MLLHLVRQVQRLNARTESLLNFINAIDEPRNVIVPLAAVGGAAAGNLQGIKARFGWYFRFVARAKIFLNSGTF